MDAPVSVRILFVEIRLRALWNEPLGDLLEATANQASTLREAGFQEIDRLQQIGVLALTGLLIPVLRAIQNPANC